MGVIFVKNAGKDGRSIFLLLQNQQKYGLITQKHRRKQKVVIPKRKKLTLKTNNQCPPMDLLGNKKKHTDQ